MPGGKIGRAHRAGDAWFAPKSEEEGYRMLLIGLLETALGDLAVKPRREEALAWLRGETDGPFSRDGVCRWLGIPPERVVRAAARQFDRPPRRDDLRMTAGGRPAGASTAHRPQP